jgi:hypothetical protein
MKRLLSFAALAAISTLTLAEPGIVTKPSELRSSPALDATFRAKVAEKTKVEILSTKGGWIEVKTADGKFGWLRLMNVEPLEAKSAGGGLKGLAAAGNIARTGSTGTTAATGVKGISKEDLAGAKANFNELAQLDRYRASPADGQQHARSAGLKAQNVETLPANAP